MRKIVIIIIVTITFFSGNVSAQGSVGSPYSRYSIGEVNYSPLIRNNAMGGIGYTIISNNNVNFVNPAGIANIDTLTFIFDFGMNGGVRQYCSSEPKISLLKNDYQISYVNFGFSAAKFWKIALGIAPYSNVGYNVSKQDSLFNVARIKRNYSGSGGVTRVYWTNAFKPFKKIDLKFGITASYLFGEINHESSMIFPNSPNDVGSFYDFYTKDIFRISAFNFEVGLQYDLVLKNKDKILFGITSNFNNDLKCFRSKLEYTINTISSIIDTINEIKENEKIKDKISIPLNIGFGIAYLLNDKFYFGVDFKYQDWSNVKIFDEKASLKNAYFISAGLEYIPVGYNGIGYKYWEFMKFRLGGYFNQTYYNLTGEKYPIDDFGITFGLGLPIKRSKTSFDISFKFGQKGTMKNNLIRERYFVAGVSFNLSDVWFVKSKFD